MANLDPHSIFASKLVSKKYDSVNNPEHYTKGKTQVWDFIVEQELPYLLGNVVKYVCRAGKKSQATHIEDLDKAVAYLNREIKRLKEDTNANGLYRASGGTVASPGVVITMAADYGGPVASGQAPQGQASSSAAVIHSRAQEHASRLF